MHEPRLLYFYHCLQNRRLDVDIHEGVSHLTYHTVCDAETAAVDVEAWALLKRKHPGYFEEPFGRTALLEFQLHERLRFGVILRDRYGLDARILLKISKLK